MIVLLQMQLQNNFFVCLEGIFCGCQRMYLLKVWGAGLSSLPTLLANGTSTFVFVNENLATVGGEKWTIQISKLWKISKLKIMVKSRQQLLLPFQVQCHRTPLLGCVRNSSC